MTLASITCWLIGAHAAIVPGVIGFTLFVVCSEEGWVNVLGSGAGLALASMTLASIGSTVALLLAGFAYHRSRAGRGHRQVAAALGLGLFTAALIWSR